MLNLLLETGAATEGGIGAMLSTMALPILLIVVMYFLMIRPQRKRDKQVQEMRSKLEVGDEIITVGGIIGRVVSIREDSLVIETSSNNSKMRIMRWAVQSNNTTHDDTAETK